MEISAETKPKRPGRPAKKRGQNDGSFTERKKGQWMGRVTLPDSGGKRVTVYGKTRQECVDQVNRVLDEHRKGVIVTENMTTGQWLTYWLEHLAPSSARPRTLVGYESNVRVHLIPALGHIPLRKLSAPDIQKMITAKRKEQVRRGENSPPRRLSETTVGHMITVLHTALAVAFDQGYVGRNVVGKVKKPQPERNEMKALTPEETNAFLEAIEGTRFEALFVVGITCGLRQGELLALKWSDVDLDSARLTVRRTVSRLVKGADGEKYAFDKPKTKGSERLLVLPALAVAALRAHRARQAEERLKTRAWTDLDLVFPNRHGRPMAENNLVARHYRPLLEAAECPPIRFHDLRHSCATALLTRGVHPKKVQELLGHSQISVTMDRYSHLMPGMHDEAAATMDALFGKQRAAP